MCDSSVYLDRYLRDVQKVPRMLTEDQKMTPRNLRVELWPKIRLGSITLILRPKRRVCNGTTLAHPILRHLKVSAAGMVTASVFLDCQSAIMMDYFGEGRTINVAYNAEELRQLRQGIWRREYWIDVFCSCKIMHQPTHLVTMTAATKCSFECLPHRPYSPDLAPIRLLSLCNSGK